MRLSRDSFTRIASFSCICFLHAGLISGFAQAPPPVHDPADTPATAPAPATTASPAVFKTTAALVLVDVLVSNGQNPIHGIPRQQFHLLEDGKEQKLIALEEHKAPDPATVQKPHALPPHIYSNIPDTSTPGATNVLLLDALNTPIADQAYVRQQMIAYLKKIPPGTRMGIFTLASRLRMVQGITSGSGPLLAALNGNTPATKSTLPNQSVLLADPYDTTTSDMDDTLSQMGATSDAMSSIQQFQADQAAFQMDLRVRFTLDALQQLARYLRGVPGRKNLIWFSGSFPLNLDPDITLMSPFDPMRNYAPEVSDTAAMLSASRVAVYPIDARGLFSDPQFNAQMPGGGISSGSAGNIMGSGTGSGRGSRGRGTGSIGGNATAPRSAQNSSKFLQQTMNEHATMQQIAEETGGQAYYDSNALSGAITQAIQGGSNYYTLAYIPEAKTDDGRLHKIQVSVPEAPSYKLIYRRGYVAETAKKQAANAPVTNISAAVLRGAPPYSEITFKVRVAPAEDPTATPIGQSPSPAGELSPKVKGPVERYSLDYAADLHNTTLTDSGDGQHQGSFEFVAIAYDRDGARLSYVDKAFQFRLTDDQLKQAMQKGLQLHQQIDLPAGEVYLRTAVHDLLSDRVGSVEIPLLVKPPSTK